jgi:hypothetical protein
VAEHISEQYVPNLMVTMVRNTSRWVFFTHALPGQGGHHHVNCRAPRYWLDLFSSYGCTLEESLTETARSLAHCYFARTGLVLSLEPGARDELSDPVAPGPSGASPPFQHEDQE